MFLLCPALTLFHLSLALPLADGWEIGIPGVDEDGNENVLIPQQENGSDCGVFTCRFGESISRRSPFNFNQVCDSLFSELFLIFPF